MLRVVSGLIVAGLAISLAGPAAAGGKIQKINATVAFIQKDKIVLHQEDRPGDNVYWHIKPKEDKVKLIVDDKEVEISAFKVKDKVVALRDPKANIFIEVRLVGAGGTKGKGKGKDKTASTELTFGTDGTVLKTSKPDASDAKDPVKKAPSKIFTVKVKAGFPYQFDVSSTKFEPYIRLESADGKMLAGEGGKTNQPRLTWE